MTEILRARTWQAPFGELLIVTDAEDRLKVLILNHEDHVAKVLRKYRDLGLCWEADASSGGDVICQLTEYFCGERNLFTLGLAPEGTPFQKKVWEELRKIPFGSVVSYGELARRIGNPKASRGVGAANGANPICIVVPCHRVIGSNNTLTGFAYGTDVKADLLRREGVPISNGRVAKALSDASRQINLF